MLEVLVADKMAFILNLRLTLTILIGKNCFIQFSIRIAGWMLLTILICLCNQLSYTLHYHILKVQMFEKCDSSNRK